MFPIKMYDDIQDIEDQAITYGEAYQEAPPNHLK